MQNLYVTVSKAYSFNNCTTYNTKQIACYTPQTQIKKGVNKVYIDSIYTFYLSLAEAEGFEPSVQLPVRKFSKLVVSATHPHFLQFVVEC